jgi:hypothetical protein
MHESYRSLRWSWIGFGWFMAASITSMVLLALIAFGVIGAEPDAEPLWIAVALLVGFFVAGLFVGTRVAAAPVLHGLAIGLLSVVAWVVTNVVAGGATGETTWRSLDAYTFTGLIVLQGVAAVVGTRMGVRWIRKPPAV